MKTLIFTLTLSLFTTLAFTQIPSEEAESRNVAAIKVPDFADRGVKSFLPGLFRSPFKMHTGYS
jgi:hypothetical protein